MLPTWSPGGGRIALTRWPGGLEFAVWVMKPDGSDRTLVVSPGMTDQHWRCPPKGHARAYRRSSRREILRAMSHENVEVFKRAFDAINRRDAEGLLSELDPEVEWHGAILMAIGGKQTMYRGHEGVREWLRDLYGTLSEFQAEYPEIRDLGDRTVAIGRIRARGTASEAEIESPHATVVEYKNGKGIRIRTYLDPKEALEAAGLPE